jgi:hypothetical protein
MTLDDLQPNAAGTRRANGWHGHVVSVQWHGAGTRDRAAGLPRRSCTGRMSRGWSCGERKAGELNGYGALFRLVSEAHRNVGRVQLAGE